jgi:hypothetical protein
MTGPDQQLSASVRAAVETLKLIDPELVKAATKTMKGAAEIIASDARSRIPDVPTGTSSTGRPHWGRWGGTRDWDAGAARRGIKTQYRGTRKNKAYQKPLISIVQSNPAGAIYDMAGKAGKYKNAQIGGKFVGSMSGKPSRTMWPAQEAKISEVNSAMESAQREMEQTINARLGKFGSSMAGF